MITPSCDEILELAKEYTTIPVCREIYADMTTPISLLRRLQTRSDRFSCWRAWRAAKNGRATRFSATIPSSVRPAKRHGNARGHGQQDGQDRQAAHRAPRGARRVPRTAVEGQPPFTGGFVGYFAYAMLGYAEPTLKIKRGAWDDFDLMLFDKVIAYDHLKQKIVLIVNMKTDSVMENYGKACAALEGMAALIADQSPLPPLKVTGKPSFTCNVTEAQYADIVEKTREYIFDGDIFQAVQSRQFSSPYQDSLLSAYRVLRTTNPSPYMVFLSIDGDEIMCSSPETLVRLDNGRLTTFPVAGSRPRGKTPEEDKALENELLADEKELSEHNMLVDLGRNDLGRVSKIGTVEVTDYMMIHRYSKIMHICSQVEGDIDEKYDACDAIEADAPGGQYTVRRTQDPRVRDHRGTGERAARRIRRRTRLSGFHRQYGYLHRHPHGCQEERHRDRAGGRRHRRGFRAV